MRAPLLLLFALPAAAGGYGHTNFGELVAAHPQAVEADATLREYQEELVNAAEQDLDRFERDVEAFAKGVQSGTLPPAEEHTQSGVLQDRRMQLSGREHQIETQVQTRRAELLVPIVKRVQAAIDATAMEHDLDAVFDTSVFNTVLFAHDSMDITQAVRSKL
jgi:Skp family chaperone for outer membrane proteins